MARCGPTIAASACCCHLTVAHAAGLLPAPQRHQAEGCGVWQEGRRRRSSGWCSSCHAAPLVRSCCKEGHNPTGTGCQQTSSAGDHQRQQQGPGSKAAGPAGVQSGATGASSRGQGVTRQWVPAPAMSLPAGQGGPRARACSGACRRSRHVSGRASGDRSGRGRTRSGGASRGCRRRQVLFLSAQQDGQAAAAAEEEGQCCGGSSGPGATRCACRAS